MAIENYFYDRQFKKYLLQFMAVFGDLHVKVGKNATTDPRLIRVPIYAASKDRVVAAIKSENTQNKLIRVPALSASIASLDMAPEARKGQSTLRRQPYMPIGGLFPDDIEVVEQRMPTPYNINFALNIWASNQDQHHQILEQILVLFNPTIQFQTSDEVFDWTKIVHLELIDIQLGENLPAGTDRRIIQTQLLFQSLIWLTAPTKVHQQFIADINTRIGFVTQMLENSDDIINDLDDQNIPYELNFSLSNIKIDS